VVYDDADLGGGKIRIRRKGGAGGHNGLKSIIGQIGSEDFVRLRVGIGPRPGGEELVDYVLSDFKPEERDALEAAVRKAVEAVGVIAEHGIDQAMNTYNEKNL
jgi:PTH1 family peptidyl-tRNA hydrolase